MPMPLDIEPPRTGRGALWLGLGALLVPFIIAAVAGTRVVSYKLHEAEKQSAIAISEVRAVRDIASTNRTEIAQERVRTRKALEAIQGELSALNAVYGRLDERLEQIERVITP